MLNGGRHLWITYDTGDLLMFNFFKVPEQETQEQTVLAHLKKYGRITSMEAISKYGITRLAARIYNLREEYTIKTEEGQNKRLGTHAVYKMEVA